MTVIGGEVLEREYAFGVLRFEDCDAGEWLTKKGEPAKKARRRYLLGDDEFDSVSSIVGALDKPGLYPWHEDMGARGAVRAERLGELADVPEGDWIKRVRALRLGANTARDEGADRGKAIHEAFHILATTGASPNPADFPGPWRPWVQGVARVWLALRPRLIDAEFIVANPDHGYAGRPDLFAIVNGKRTLIDYKTGKGRVYDQAHFQTRGYAECFEPCGLDAPERILIVGIDDAGGFELVDCEASPVDWYALLTTFRARKRINAGMARQRAVAKEAAA